jgi:hypothetical protein
MMLCKVISFVENALSPADWKLALARSIEDPTEMHVDRFGSFLFHIVVGNASGSAVVCLQRGGWLWTMAEFFETRSQPASFFSIVEMLGSQLAGFGSSTGTHLF